MEALFHNCITATIRMSSSGAGRGGGGGKKESILELAKVCFLATNWMIKIIHLNDYRS